MKLLTVWEDASQGPLLAYNFILNEFLLHGSLGLLSVVTWAGEMSILLHVSNFNLSISIISLNTSSLILKWGWRHKKIPVSTRKFNLNRVHFTCSLIVSSPCWWNNPPKRHPNSDRKSENSLIQQELLLIGMKISPLTPRGMMAILPHPNTPIRCHLTYSPAILRN